MAKKTGKAEHLLERCIALNALPSAPQWDWGDSTCLAFEWYQAGIGEMAWVEHPFRHGHGRGRNIMRIAW